MATRAGGGVSVSVQGDKQLIERLKKLRTTEANKIIRKGLRAGAKVVHRATMAAAPIGPKRKGHKPGTLKRSFKVRAMKRKRGRVGILVQSGEGFFKGRTFYSGFVALGHKIGIRPSRDKGNIARLTDEITKARGSLEDTVDLGSLLQERVLRPGGAIRRALERRRLKGLRHERGIRRKLLAAKKRSLTDTRGFVKPNKFMKRAADKSAPEAIRILEDTVKRELDAMPKTVKVKT